MNSQITVETVTEKIQQLTNISVVLLAVSVALFIAAIIVFIVFKIPHSIRVLTGMGKGKEINRINHDARSGQARTYTANHRATVSWNNSERLSISEKLSISGKLNKAAAATDDEATTLLVDDEATTLLTSEETILLSDDSTTLLGAEETTLLSDDSTTLLGEEETTLLSDLTPLGKDSDFEMEEDIKITGR